MKTVESNHILKSALVALVISILSASVYSSNEGAEQLPTASKSSATSNIDIDGNEEFDALTDGLLILRSMFGLTDSPLITGAVAGDALYVDAEEIQSRIEGLGNRLDIDNDGNIDALTDGLVTLRYLFGLTGDPLISGVIATGADRITAEDIEAYMAVLTSLDTEPPVFTSQETFTAPENQTAIGTVTATDANSPSIAFSISGSELSITSDGVLSFASAPDYETKTSYTATVTASDGTNLTTQAIVVSVSDVDEAPIMGVLNYTADENQTSIGSVVATDPEGEAVSLSVSGSELLITSDGVLTFASAPDYETKSSYTATVTATDGTNSTDQSVTVTVTDVDDEAPVFTSSATFSAAENQTAIDTVTATDVDTDNSAITFTVSGSELSITSAGVLTFASAPDYETKTSYTASVTATDGTNSSTQSITVNVTNVNDNSPAFTSSTAFSADENQTSIGTVTATDGDVSDSVTFTVSGSELSITSAGVLTFASAPDYETKSSYTATVTATDGTNSTDQIISVTVTDVDDVAPVFTSSATFSAAENQTAIDTVTATDVDTDNSAITFTVSGSELSITSAGVLTFASAPDYETKTSYSATVTATDGANSTTQDITVNIANLPNVSGIAYTSRYSVMDSDIPNTDYFPYASNDTVADSQTLINPSVVTGFIGGSDTLDVYSVSTSSSMYVNLDVVDYINDSKELRLYIYESDGSGRDFSYASASTEANMTILLPNGGDYLIVVRQQNNSSKYILTLGQRYSSSSMEVATDFIPNYVTKEFVGYVPQNKESLNPKISKSSNRVKELELSKNELFDLTGFSFDDPGIRSFQIKKIKQLQLELSDQTTINKSIISGLQPISQKQAAYLNDWSQLQYLRSLDSNTIFDLNYTYQLSSFTRDPLYSLQWNLERVGLEPALNALGQDVKDVAVAVIDSGGPTPNSTAWNASNLIDGGYDFVNGESRSIDYLATSANTGNNLSHGTHVSTTISAKNDGFDFNGYAVKALNINVFSVIGTGANAKTGGGSNANIANAILYASGLTNSSGSVAPNTTPIKVINLSLGSPSYSETLCAAVTDAISQGITVIAASGNAQDTNPGSISYPAACPGVISVGATNSAGEISSYSQQNTHVDISAPGGDSVDRDGNGIPDLILAYGNDGADPIKAFTAGTSMASPQVSAAIALMYAVDSSMTPSRVENMLMAGELTNDLGDSGKDNVYGYGSLNIPKAIENVLQDISSSTTYAYTSASYLDFASTSTQLTIDLLKVGTGTLSVSSLGADNASGLSYDDSSANSDGFGTYTIIIDRSSIPNGEFSNTIYFNLSNGKKVAARIYYDVGSLRSRANIGKAYIGMYDASDDSLWGSLEAVVNGSVSFTATDVAPGNYYILTSTDIDDDNTVCDYGELCEYYPKLGETTYYFTVSDSNLTDYEIFLQPLVRYGGVNAASIENNTDQLNKINKTRKQKSFNQIGNIDINPINSNIEFKQDDIGVKGDKKFISN